MKKHQLKTGSSLSGLVTIFVGLIFLMSGACKKDKPQLEPLKNIGDMYGGGIIYNRVTYNSWITGDLESCIYSIASLNDIPASAPWGCSGVLILCDNNNTDGFLGRHYTIIIADSCPESGIAAKLCRSATLNGCNDWWLPSIDELNVMYSKKEMIGGFSNGTYWSCDQFDSCLVFCFDFGKGRQCLYNKDSLLYIRPVRAVEIDFN